MIWLRWVREIVVDPYRGGSRGGSERDVLEYLLQHIGTSKIIAGTRPYDMAAMTMMEYASRALRTQQPASQPKEEGDLMAPTRKQGRIAAQKTPM